MMDSGTLLESNQWKILTDLVEALKSVSSISDKISLLNASPRVEKFLNASPLVPFLKDPETELVVKSLVAIGQEGTIFSADETNLREKLDALVRDLLPVEKFYADMGGIVGYHWLVLFYFISPKKKTKAETFLSPPVLDITKETETVRKAVLWGIEKLGEMAEIYPVGGAADRLRLHDEKSLAPLPAARLLFSGKTLLEGMVTDLQAREYLHYKLYRRQLCTPVAMMTSQEKDNHAQILSICEETGWFGRPKALFRFFSQPSVPSLNRKGEWCVQAPLQLLLKPGGHGVIWKLARDHGVFDWFFSQGRKKALVRQINNPVAGVDYGLLVLAGVGCKENKIFGFASCPRKEGAAEGVDVLIHRPKEKGAEYLLTNIEYCDFKKFSTVLGSYLFPANTNILFVDLKEIYRAVEKCPVPGMLVNPKKTLSFRGEQKVEEEVMRLESTMQNIADCFGRSSAEQLDTFVTFNRRDKTISTVKREHCEGGPLLETPEGCFLDQMENARELLSKLCGMTLPPKEKGPPPFLFLYHPALGPLYSIIAQKIRGGRMGKGSELQLEIAEIEMEGLDVEGCLSIRADSVMGHTENALLRYSEKAGKCTLKNVRVRNQGIDWTSVPPLWKREMKRKEMCQIILRGSGEFYAENVTLEGSLTLEVNDGERLTARQEKGKLTFIREKIEKPTWWWRYTTTSDHHILLRKYDE